MSRSPDGIWKLAGWRGKRTDLWWTKDTAYGVKYMCSSCGQESLGMSDPRGPRMHRQNCPRLAAAGKARTEEKGEP